MSTFGKAIEISLFGESHGPYIGLTIHNLPAGLEIDHTLIKHDLTLRRPAGNISTPRQEQDPYELISGEFNGYTTGQPLTFIIKNSDTRSKDYQPEILRPSTSDYTAHIKYKGYNDYRGSGHFSGRITAALMILGSISKQFLAKQGITVSSHILSIGDIKDQSFYDVEITTSLLQSLNTPFPLLDPSKEEEMRKEILNKHKQQSSVGGQIETCVLGMKPGYGNPFFEKADAFISSLIMSIPAVRGIYFGNKEYDGIKNCDELAVVNNKITTLTNNSGGINGGITNGMPILFTTDIKPTGSITKELKTINTDTLENTTINLRGRHDPTIVHRASHVVTALSAYAILELLAREDGLKHI